MKSIKRLHFISLLFILISLFVTACDTNWFVNFKDEIESETSTKITFLESTQPDAKSTFRYYRLGTVVTAADLPDHTDSEISKWKPTAKIKYWKYYQETDTGTDIASKGYVTAHDSDGVNISLVPFWIYRGYVQTKVEGIDGTISNEGSPVACWGLAGVEIASTVNSRPGFTVVLPSETFDPDDPDLTADVTYLRKDITLNFQPGREGEFVNTTNSAVTITGKYGAPVTPPDVRPKTAGAAYFVGWNPEVPATFPEENPADIYVAQWSSSKADISYKDWNGGISANDAKSYTGKVVTGQITENYFVGYDTELIDLESTVSGVTLEGIYFDKDCSSSQKLPVNAGGKYYIPSTKTGDLTLYAKWNYPNVYLDPVNGDDTKTGIDKNNALKTVAAVKKYLECGQDGINIRMLNSLSDKDEIEALNGTYDASYNNAVVAGNTSDKSTVHHVFVIDSSVSLNKIKIVSDWSGSPVYVDSGDLIVNSLTVQTGSQDGIEIASTGSLTVKGTYEYTATSASSNAVNLKAASTGSLIITQNAIINSGTNPGILLGDSKNFKLANPVNGTATIASIKVSDTYANTSPVIITSDTSGLVKTCHTRFETKNPGYSISEGGKLVRSSNIGVSPENPIVTQYDPGTPETTTVVDTASTTLKIIVPAATYYKIAEWGGNRFIQYTVNGKYGAVPIEDDGAGGYYALLYLERFNDANMTNYTYQDLNAGPSSVVIYGAAVSPLFDVISVKEFTIFVIK